MGGSVNHRPPFGLGPGRRLGSHSCVAPILRPGRMSIKLLAPFARQAMLRSAWRAAALLSRAAAKPWHRGLPRWRGPSGQLVDRRNVADGAHANARCCSTRHRRPRGGAASSSARLLTAAAGRITHSHFPGDACQQLQLPVRLWIVGAGAYVRHAAHTDELLEIAGNELRTVVGDDPWMPMPGQRAVPGDIFPEPAAPRFPRRLLRHAFTNLRVDDRPAVTIEGCW